MREIVFDTETTGLDPRDGHRLVEFAGIELVERVPTGRHLHVYVNPGRSMPAEALAVHGLTEDFLADKPRFAGVAGELQAFLEGATLVAHNAAFDSKFWLSELAHAGLGAPQPFACTVLLSRRLYPQAPSHKLGALVDYHHLPRTGRAHRALADAEMAAALLAQIQHDLRHRWGVGQPTHELLMTLQRCAKPKIGGLLREWALAHPVQAELLVSSPP